MFHSIGDHKNDMYDDRNDDDESDSEPGKYHLIIFEHYHDESIKKLTYYA